MSLFRHHDRADAGDHESSSFEVLGADRVILRFTRDDFDMIAETTDPDEVRRKLERGWVILHEREVPGGGRQAFGADLIVGIEGIHVGGLVGPATAETTTRYSIGILKDGAQGEPVA